MDKEGLVKIEIKREIANRLIKLKKVGDTYSDIIERLLKLSKKED